MEHSVLCGSRKYPVKEPFVELIKGSLNTFLNAFTFPDKTCYPVASQNAQDFYNLIDVYLDAVLYPNLTRHTFEQEGWHYELDSLEDAMAFKGVVFNEMKGAYSTPEEVLAQQSQSIVFPENTYFQDSGGDPRVIPDLTYEAFKDFHQRYYHPSNAFIYFYGDDAPEKRLEIVDAFLKDFDRVNVDSAIAMQQRYTQPRRTQQFYEVTPEDEAPKAMVTVNWLLPDGADAEEKLAFSILNEILIGTPASPLRKALIDSGLGEDLTGRGVETSLAQMMFSVGMKGVQPADLEKVESLILDTLQQLAANGIDRDAVAAAMNTVEFALRENNTGSFPRGLAVMLRVLDSWLYDRDPLALVRYDPPLSAIKVKIEAGRYFEQLIEEHLVKNAHRGTVVLLPDAELAQQRETAEQARLKSARDGLSAAELEAIVANTRQLKLLQETPDTPEALATIPVLKLDDLDRKVRTIPSVELSQGGVRLLHHDLFTNGIFYLDLGFDLHALPQELLPYVPLFARALLETGTAELDFVQLVQRIGRSTGGIYHTLFASSNFATRKASNWLFLRGKCSSCQARISARYPIVETLTALLTGFAAMHFGFGWNALGAFVLIWSLTALTFIDFDTTYLPDSITLPLLWSGLLINLSGTYTDLPSAVIGAMAGYMSLWSVYWSFKLITGKEGMGYGDFKLLAALGAWLGWQMLPLIILLSSLVGAVIGLLLIILAKRGRDVPIPFGPYLAIAGLLALFWGNELTQGYLRLI